MRIAPAALAAALALAASFAPLGAQDTLNFPSLGEIVRKDPALDKLLPSTATIEVLSSGFAWSEGPVWVAEKGHPHGGYVLFSDIPNNRVVRWEEGVGAKTWLQPSGYTGVADYGGEPGCNGLLLDGKGRLISCEHGDRRLSLLTANGGKRTLVDHYEGKRLNSPNDLVYRSDGALFFTDPPFGFPKFYKDPRKELPFSGVYS
ncbi:MAG: SMP-30/gluconolactonase/LRE family protein, partial [Planctomycetaceae bacterium]|nr:SMP-30/gluconolactonase/LRE family protein [Planctomycetaceae bacterium]